jgi:uncharacterized Zn-binding protein involved in type VI secretion
MPPAARVTDMHTCPMSSGPVPHVGGPILPPCSVNVMTGSLNAARVSDLATCVGPPDAITKGAFSVLINGLPAARLTDLTMHGGLITAPGWPTVEIGDPAFAIPSVIQVKGDPIFIQKTIRDLVLIGMTPSGQALFARLQAAGKPIQIVYSPVPDNAGTTPGSSSDATNGKGTGSTITYNPSANGTVYDLSGNTLPDPAQVMLGHELIHSLRNAEGTNNFKDIDPSAPASEPNMPDGEGMAIGAGSHTGDYPTENSLRRDLGPQYGTRDNHYGGPTDPIYPTPSGIRPGGDP